MKTYVLLHFEYENDVIIIKHHRATRLGFLAPIQKFDNDYFYVQNVIEHRF